MYKLKFFCQDFQFIFSSFQVAKMPKVNWNRLLKEYRKDGKKDFHKSRLDLHSLWRVTPEDAGLIPFPEELQYVKPKQVC